jgi:hypothetical protein
LSLPDGGADRPPAADELWLEFLSSDKGDGAVHCGLCGNHGIVCTFGHVRTPAGVECGVQRFCICPNGRALKRQRDPRMAKAIPEKK